MELNPGFVVLHSNRQEWLCQVLVDWMRRQPLAPLEDEVVLVQSNGIAQWLKIEVAARSGEPGAAQGGLGICACLDAQMPGRFLWQAYRAVLGEENIPEASPFEKSRLVWRLLRLLPQLLEHASFEPLRRFLRDDADLRKRYQLAERLADLFDQYQVYRSDWLAAWADGDDVLLDGAGGTVPLDPQQCWQPALWRALRDDLPGPLRASSRAAVHQRFRQAVAGLSRRPPALARRILVFGVSSMPQQILEALSELGRFSQVVLFVHNPCRYYWADIIEGRELLRVARRRQQPKPGMPDAADPEAMHAASNPLLAAWGRQGRDYIGLLDGYDQPECYRDWVHRSELFEPWGMAADDGPLSLLARLQNGILDLDPAPERGRRAIVASNDDSIVFHTAHGPMREVEILHDQLLAAFQRAADAGTPLQPRDVLVMVPDIDRFSPLVDAVFGRFTTDHPRFVPYTIADRGTRGRNPLLQALEYLLGLPLQRLLLAEVMDLLDVPAVRRRFGMEAADVPELEAWMRGAGARWGMDAAHRLELRMPPGFTQNSWAAALGRMLLGYAVGRSESWRGTEPFAEIGGLSAQRLGPLTALLQTLHRYRPVLASSRSPGDWGLLLRDLLNDFFQPEEEDEKRLMHKLADALEAWLAACEEAGLDEPLPLAVAAEAWLDGLDQDSLSQRFLGGSVNFCTLMPMRAIPFRMVCLLGMNDGDYPRIQPPADFDLMHLPGQYRPGDRSRREDDRYLFLEALLSARERLYVSWAGRGIADNSEQPPSVLVAQLRDHIDAGWVTADGASVLGSVTTEHPLQPFSPAYFRGTGPFTYADDWRAMYEPPTQREGELATATETDTLVLNLQRLVGFLRQPAAFFLRERLGIDLRLEADQTEDTEPVALDALERHIVEDQLVRSGLRCPEDPAAGVAAGFGRLRMAGMLPAAAFAEVDTGEQRARAVEAAERATLLLRQHPHPLAPCELRLELPGVPVLEDWIDGLRRDDEGRIARVEVVSGKKVDRHKAHRLLRAWVQHVAAVAAGIGVTTHVVAHPDTLCWTPDDVDRAESGEEDASSRAYNLLERWLNLYLQGLNGPLPVACETAIAWLNASEGREESAARTTYEGGSGPNATPGECLREPGLARFYPDFDHLYRDGERFAALAEALYGNLVNALGATARGRS